MSEIPQPEDIYRRTREEGERRLERPLLEMISTALAAGFDIVAGVLALALVIVVTLELIFGYRLGAHFGWTFILGNFLLAAVGNMVGGLGLVTLNRLTQGKQGERSSASA